MRSAPGFLFRDRIIHYKKLADGARETVYSEGKRFRCHWEGRSRLLDDRRVRQRSSYAKVWIPMSSRRRTRLIRRTRDVRVSTARIGSRVGAGFIPRPSANLIMPFELAREREITTTTVDDADIFRVEDRIRYRDRDYQIVDVQELDDKPTAGSHWVLTVADQLR